MKLLILSLILISCGKKIPTSHEQLNSLSNLIDSDGDGVSDKEEIQSGRNHLIADINTNQKIVNESIILVDSVLREYELFTPPTRLIRSQLLQKIIGVSNDEISDINKFTIDLNANEDFWKSYHEGVQFYQFYYKHEKSTQYPLPSDFHEHKTIPLNSFTQYDILGDVKKATYRLIISTPENESIFYLHPSISLVDFLKTELKAEFKNDQLHKIDQHIATETTKSSLFNNDEATRWEYYSDSLKVLDAPQAGKTYAFVFANIKDFKKSSLKKGSIPWNNKVSIPFAHRIESTLFFPSIQKRVVNTTTRETLMDINNIEFRCSYTDSHDMGMTYYSPTTEMISEWLNSSLFEDVQIQWAYTSDRGTTIRLRAYVSQIDGASYLNSRAEDAKVKIGSLQSDCPYFQPNHNNLPMYSELKQFYLAD